MDDSNFNTVAQNLVDGLENPGEITNIEYVEGLPHETPVDTLISDKNVDSPSTAPVDPGDTSRFAFFGLAEALGFTVDTEGKEKVYLWSYADEFDINEISTVEKKKDKPFVILNLADVQLCDLEDFFNFRTIKREIKYLVDAARPDLITLTGDQTWSNENLISLKRLVGFLDSLRIPYAPVFGNHDYGNEMDSAVLSQRACCDVYENGKYSLFSRGPTNIGALGNYALNIVEDGAIVKTLYMLDSGYLDALTDGQIEWFKWTAEGIKAATGAYSKGMCFMHKPLPEYSFAYRAYKLGEAEAMGDVHVNYSLSGSLQRGFFDEAKARNVSDVVCGHQHGNNFTICYEGVRLTFALKTGELGGFWRDETVNLNGATFFTLSGGETTAQNVFVPRGEFEIKNSNNVYEKYSGN
ncbi:MAG: metallophosphoesterase, partial [Clostridia bacterium]|nr:metallophosphoesterase [Clostridia bacterium]